MAALVLTFLPKQSHIALWITHSRSVTVSDALA